MDTKEAIARSQNWENNPRSRPDPTVARVVATTLLERIAELEASLAIAQRLSVGRVVEVQRGNPSRGPESGPGFGRSVPAVLIGFHEPNQVECRLLADDLHAVSAPRLAGEVGHWGANEVRVK